VSGLLIGYARVSTDAQDLTAQRDALAALGVPTERVYVDHGLTGAHRDRPGLREALAACRAGDTLVVSKLDRLARSLPDARDIAENLTGREVRLNLGGSIYDPTDPVGRLLFNVLAMVAEFEADLIRARTREGMKVAEGRQGQGAPTRQATQAHRDAGSAPRRAARRRHVHERRARRALQRCALDRLPGAAARQRRRVGARGRIGRDAGANRRCTHAQSPSAALRRGE
jgi:DNA invertase Pin-like site-specific DNA recombinase